MSSDMSLSYASGVSGVAIDSFAAQDELLKVIESTMGCISSLVGKHMKEQMSFSALSSLIGSVIKITLSTAGVASVDMEQKVLKEIMEQGLLPRPSERKGALSGYTLFTKEKHAEFKENNGYNGKKPIELTKEIAAMWKALNDEEKQQYNKRSAEMNAENPGVSSKKGSKKSTKSRKTEAKHTCSFVMTKGDRMGQPCGASVRSDEPTHDDQWLCTKHATAEKKKVERAESKKSEKKSKKSDDEEEEKPKKKKTKKTEEDVKSDDEEEKPKKSKKSKKTEEDVKSDDEEEEKPKKKKTKKTEEDVKSDDEEEEKPKKSKKSKKSDSDDEEEKPKKKTKKTDEDVKSDDEEEKPKKKTKNDVKHKEEVKTEEKKDTPVDAKAKVQAILNDMMDEYEIKGKMVSGSMSKENIEKLLGLKVSGDDESYAVSLLYPPTSLLFTIEVDDEEMEKRVSINDKTPSMFKQLHQYLKML
jgi:hypothetical protein